MLFLFFPAPVLTNALRKHMERYSDKTSQSEGKKAVESENNTKRRGRNTKKKVN